MSESVKLNEEELDNIIGGKKGGSDKEEKIYCQYCDKQIVASKFKDHVNSKHPGNPVIY